MRDVNNGWLIRYLHSNTASAFFFLVSLFVFIVCFYLCVIFIAISITKNIFIYTNISLFVSWHMPRLNKLIFSGGAKHFSSAAGNKRGHTSNQKKPLDSLSVLRRRFFWMIQRFCWSGGLFFNTNRRESFETSIHVVLAQGRNFFA